MKKKILNFILVLCMFTIFVPSHVSASNSVEYGFLKFNKDTGTITECEYEASGDLVIPSEIEGVKVTEIAGLAFLGCENLTSITLPDSLTSIGIEAFVACKNLENINLPNSLTEIGYGAFKECDSLTEIKLPTGLKILDESLFRFCDNLKDIYIPEGIIQISNGAFADCPNLKEITIPKSTKVISNSAFVRSTKISDVYYAGTEKEWKEIEIAENNDCLINATIHYNAIGKAIPQIVNTPTVTLNEGSYEFNIELKDVEYSSSLVTVLFDNGMLSGYESTPIEAGDTTKIVNITADNADKAKIFIWDSLSGMRPLCDAVTVDGTEFVTE